MNNKKYSLNEQGVPNLWDSQFDIVLDHNIRELR